ncbi:MAG: hypothetical protein WAW86_10615 [Gammaproteobacteria bacterium]
MDRTEKKTQDESTLADHQLNLYGPEKIRRDFIKAQAVIYRIVNDNQFEEMLINVKKAKKERDEFDREMEKYIQSLRDLNATLYPIKDSTAYHKEVSTLLELQERLANLIKAIRAEIKLLTRRIEFLQNRINENIAKKDIILSKIQEFKELIFSDKANYFHYDHSNINNYINKDEFKSIGRKLSDNIFKNMVTAENIQDAVYAQLPAFVSQSALEKIGNNELADIFAKHIKSQNGFENVAQSTADVTSLTSQIEHDKDSAENLIGERDTLISFMSNLVYEVDSLVEKGYMDESFMDREFTSEESIQPESSISNKEKMLSIGNMFLEGDTLSSKLSHYDDPFADDIAGQTQSNANENDQSAPRMGR